MGPAYVAELLTPDQPASPIVQSGPSDCLLILKPEMIAVCRLWDSLPQTIRLADFVF